MGPSCHLSLSLRSIPSTPPQGHFHSASGAALPLFLLLPMSCSPPQTQKQEPLVCVPSQKLLQIIAVDLLLGCSLIYEAITAKGNLIVSQVCLKPQLMGNPAAAMTFDQRKAVVVIITNCFYLNFLNKVKV